MVDEGSIVFRQEKQLSVVVSRSNKAVKFFHSTPAVGASLNTSARFQGVKGRRCTPGVGKQECIGSLSAGNQSCAACKLSGGGDSPF